MDTAQGNSIVLVQATPLIMLGLKSTITDAPELSNYEALSFRTLEQAYEKLDSAKFGDIVILDTPAWDLINTSKYSSLFERIKARTISVGLIGFPHRIYNGSELVYEILGSIEPEAELYDVISMMKDLAACRNHVSKSASTKQFAKLFMLTEREIEILELMSRGFSNKEIALQLQVREGTLKSHISKIFKKMNCHQRARAIVVFLQSSRRG